MGKTKRKKKGTIKNERTHKAKTLFQNIWAVIINKQDTQGEFTRGTLILLMTYLLNIVAALLALFSIIGVCVTIYEIVFILNWSSIVTWFYNISAIIIIITLCMIAFLLAIMLRGFANEVEHEKDRDYIVAIFSGVVSFAALIISLIALVRG